MTEIVTREAAKAAGLPRYRPGAPCPKGHDGERHTASGKCVECRKIERGSVLREDRSPAERRERFCQIYVDNAGQGKEAAQRAGWPAAGAAQRAAEMLRDPKITERISELLREKFVVEGQKAHEILLKLSKKSSPADAVKLRAAKELMTLGGLFQKTDARQQALDAAKLDATTLKAQLMMAAGLMVTQLAPDANGHQTGIKFAEASRTFTVTNAEKAGAHLTYLLSIVSKLHDRADAEVPAAPPVVSGEEPAEDEDEGDEDWVAA